MKPNIKLIAKILFIGIAFVFTIKWLGIEKRVFLSSDLVCPSFGNLSTIAIPKQSIYIDPIHSIKKIGIRNKLGEKKFYPASFLNGALFIKSQNELNEYLSIYADICGGKPPFYQSIDFVKIARIKNIENQRLENTKESRKDWRNFYAKEKRLISDKSFLENKIASLQSKLDRITPVSFNIIGKVAETTKDSLIVFGSAVPDSAKAKDNMGFVYNGVIILKNAKKSDIASPDYYSTKHVLAKDYYFVKRIDGRDTFGHFMPVSVYARNVKVTSPKVLSELRKEIANYESKLSKIELELKSMEHIEEHYLATVM
ncbi:MAG TPA: hypothetical protein PK079_13320 [Leptospiraceae bacterium]|nr:hypothetical protein [Leptospiraceae bacterium]HMW03723.1 hypothetical protein [Leptospiraceae bacterium]HMX31836.1 hypothetical protein [Leptospiraceae bacterium]HMY29703.1 hypothetical protein [Leptospiraceae bacterium]HMZ64021.1 hypothetical protein [Leptospiraceae bacterium]